MSDGIKNNTQTWEQEAEQKAKTPTPIEAESVPVDAPASNVQEGTDDAIPGAEQEAEWVEPEV